MTVNKQFVSLFSGWNIPWPSVQCTVSTIYIYIYIHDRTKLWHNNGIIIASQCGPEAEPWNRINFVILPYWNINYLALSYQRINAMDMLWLSTTTTHSVFMQSYKTRIFNQFWDTIIMFEVIRNFLLACLMYKCSLFTMWLSQLIKMIKLIAAFWQNQQIGMCSQRRLRSAWASAQSDQSLRCALSGLGIQAFFKWTAKTDQTGWMPGLIWVFAGRTCHFVGFVMMRLM